MICPFASPNIGGVEAHLDKLINKLLKLDFKVNLVAYQPLTTKAKGPAIEKKGNLEIYRVQWFGYNLFHKLEPYFFATFFYLFPGLFLKSLFIYLKKHNDIDVIHAHGLTGALIAKILKKIHKKRTVVSTHAVYNFEKRNLLSVLVKFILKDFDKVLAVGETSKEELKYIGIPEEKLEIHPNWIDLNRFVPLDKIKCREHLGFDKNAFIVFYLGRLIDLKGVNVLLDVAKEVIPDINFVFAGDGPLSEAIKDVEKKCDNIFFRGKVDAVDIVMYYNLADIFVLPSQYNEGFATVILESIACGVPVLVTNKGCVPWYVDSSVGDVIDPTKENIKGKILYYCNNPDKLKDKASLCREYAKNKFSEKNFEVILKSYDE